MINTPLTSLVWFSHACNIPYRFEIRKLLSAINGKLILTGFSLSRRIPSIYCFHSLCDVRSSTEIIAILTPSSSNSSCIFANAKISDVQTGVKSFGWLKSIFQLFPKSFGNSSLPFVVCAVKEGAVKPNNGILFCDHAAKVQATNALINNYLNLNWNCFNFILSNLVCNSYLHADLVCGIKRA